MFVQTVSDVYVLEQSIQSSDSNLIENMCIELKIKVMARHTSNLQDLELNTKHKLPRFL